MMGGCVLITCVLTLILCTVHRTDADGVISIRFIEFINPGGKGDNGHCCDGKFLFCQRRGCDHEFTICLDDDDKPGNFDQCYFGKYQTYRIKNEDVNNFGSSIGGVVNPMSFEVLGGPILNATLKVNVYDDDRGITKDDFVDYLEMKNITPESGNTVELKIEARTTLRIAVTVTCNNNWFGKFCETSCVAVTGDHYTCNSNTGERICDDGWTGSDCNDPTDPFVDRPNADCDRLVTHGGVNSSGRYDIHVGDIDPFSVYCVVTDEKEGWTVIQQRFTGRANFTRNWQQYKQGFGARDGDGDFWLGLEKIHQITRHRRYKLRVVLQIGDAQGMFKEIYADYEYFTVASEGERYKLHTEGYSGTAEDSLGFDGFGGTRNHEMMAFSTYDQDNDQWPDGNCARVYQSGWWYNDCFWSNLNGEPRCTDASCISWHGYLLHRDETIHVAAMMILPNPRF